MIVTIDGPAASGKGVTARRLSRELGFFYLNTGLLYRAIGYLLVTSLGYTQERLSEPSAQDVQACADKILYTYSVGEGENVYVDGVDLTVRLKEKAVDTYASLVAVSKVVREAVVAIEHGLAREQSVVVDGRDSGSAVFPQAEHKFFLTASPGVRAQRWQKDQNEKGNSFSLDEARAIIEERDKRDSERVIAPLVVPEGAQVVDNSELTIEETVQVMLESIRQ